MIAWRLRTVCNLHHAWVAAQRVALGMTDSDRTTVARVLPSGWSDVLVCWRLDRLGRNLRHLILFLDELSALGVAFVSLAEGSTPQRPLDASSHTCSARLPNSRGPGFKSESRSDTCEGARCQARRTMERIDPEGLATVAGSPEREAARRLGIPPVHSAAAVGPKPAEPTS